MAEAPRYDRDAWRDVQDHKRRQAARRPRNFVPEWARTRLDETRRRVLDLLETAPGREKFEAIFTRSLSGVGTLITKTGVHSIRMRRVVRSYAKAGHDVTRIEHIRGVSLQDIDDVRPPLDLIYASVTAATGAVGGFIAGGGTLAAIAGTAVTPYAGGAGGAPAIGLVMGTLAVDAGVTVGAVQRGVAHVAAYYGYDMRRPEERLFALGVMNAALAGGSKAAAYAELNKLVQQLARRATWKKLNENVVANVTTRVLQRFGFQITKRKLAEITPFVGAAIGAGLNAQLLNSALEETDVLYRERYLVDRYGPDGPGGEGAFVVLDGEPSDDILDLSDMVEAELASQITRA